MSDLHSTLTCTVVLLLLMVTAHADAGRLDQHGSEYFELSVSQMFDDEGRTLLVVSTAIPYRRLVFFRKGGRYEAGYRVYMEMKDRKGRYVRGDVWEKFLAVESYEEVNSASAVSISRNSFIVEPGEYNIKVTLEVVNTSLRFKRETSIRIVGYDEGKLGLADPVFLIADSGMNHRKPSRGEMILSTCMAPDDVGFRMNPGAVYAEFGAWPRVTYNLVGHAAEGRENGCVISSRVTNSRGEVVLYNRRAMQMDKNRYLLFCLDFNIDDFVIGEFEVSTVVEAPKTNEKASVHGRFTVLLNRGLLGEHFEKALELLSIIAEDDELTELKGALPADRLDAWRRFWKRRDSSPRTGVNEELGDFLNRARHVLKTFSKYRPGWETDRGRIYIRHGPPDKIIDRQGKSLGSNYRLWYYYSRSIVYIFEDSMGMGEFRLMMTQPI